MMTITHGDPTGILIKATITQGNTGILIEMIDAKGMTGILIKATITQGNTGILIEMIDAKGMTGILIHVTGIILLAKARYQVTGTVVTKMTIEAMRGVTKDATILDQQQ